MSVENQYRRPRKQCLRYLVGKLGVSRFGQVHNATPDVAPCGHLFSVHETAPHNIRGTAPPPLSTFRNCHTLAYSGHSVKDNYNRSDCLFANHYRRR
jgi:hypothetical protein